MTPEMRLAQFLSGNEETKKIQAEVRGFSMEELEGLLKTANGDMLQYFQDHPEKLKEKQERDRKKEKRSSSKTEDNEAQSSDIKADMEKDEKLSPQDLMKKADAMGREMAQQEKTAEKDTDRAKKYGRRGAALVGGATAAGTALNLHSMSKAGLKPLDAIKRNKGLAAGVIGGGLLANAAGGYVAGRLAHRAIHGKATGKEVEKKAGTVIPFPGKMGPPPRTALTKIKELGSSVAKGLHENRGTVGLLAGSLTTAHAADKEIAKLKEKHKAQLSKTKKAEAEKTAVLAYGAGKALGAIGGAAKAVGGAAKAIPGALKAAPGAAKSGLSSVGNFLKKDLAATKQQFSAGMAGQARPALAKTPVPGIHHNAMPAAAAPAAASSAARPGMGTALKVGLGAGAAGVGLGMAGHAAMDRQKQQQQGMMRTASVEKTAVSFNQVNEGTKMLGRATRLYDRFKKPVGDAAKAVGSKIHSGVKNLGSKINNINDPIIKGTTAGALLGGVGGAATGAILPDKDELGQNQRGKTMLRRGVAGALSGAATGAITGAMQKSSSVQKLEKAAAGLGLSMGGIGSMAKNFVASAKPVAQKGMAMAAKNPTAAGAAVGGTFGALHGAATAQPGQSRLRAAGNHALVGGAAGMAGANLHKLGL